LPKARKSSNSLNKLLYFIAVIHVASNKPG
jgi:hypothetical protein